MKVLVTGGAGFIGSHTSKALAAAGHVPIAYDDLSTGHVDAVRYGVLERGDIKDGDRLADVMARHRPEAVMHFAANAYVGESVRDPHKYYANNVSGTIATIKAALDSDVRLFVFSSSCATYGVPATLPIQEDTPQRPINPYGRSKLMAEEILRDICEAHGIRYAGLRYFNAAGADPDGDLEERHDPETHLIPVALQAAFGLRSELPIFGSDLPTPDGTCIRDYIHVSDLARGHVLALDHLAAGGGSLFVNLGTGRGHSIRQVIASIEQVTGRTVPVTLEPPRPGDPPCLVADPSRANEVLGFRPAFSDLETMIRTAARRYERLARVELIDSTDAAP